MCLLGHTTERETPPRQESTRDYGRDSYNRDYDRDNKVDITKLNWKSILLCDRHFSCFNVVKLYFSF